MSCVFIASAVACNRPARCLWPPLPASSLPTSQPCFSMPMLASPRPQWTFHRLGPSLGRGSISPSVYLHSTPHPRCLGIERQPGTEAPMGCLDWPSCTSSVLITVSSQPFVDVTQASCALLPAAWHYHSLYTYCVSSDRGGGLHVNCFTQPSPQLCQVYPISQKSKLKEFRTFLQVTYLITRPTGALIQIFLLP